MTAVRSPLGQPCLILLGADLSEHDGIDDFEMRGVGGQRQVNGVAVEHAIGRSAEVILHIARAFDVVGLERAALELLEDGAQRLRHHVGEHVETAAVGHAHRDFPHAQMAAALDDLLERGNDQFRAIEAKALGAGVFEIAEFLEGLGLDQLAQDGLPALGREANVFLRAFDALLDPAFLRRVGDVGELHADFAAVGSPQDA